MRNDKDMGVTMIEIIILLGDSRVILFYIFREFHFFFGGIFFRMQGLNQTEWYIISRLEAL